MADWTRLPGELIDLISKHLISETDLLRFRSVCTSWRSSSVQPFTFRFHILPRAGISDTTWGFYLSKRTVFRISSPDDHSQIPWLIKVERDNPQKTRLMNPLIGSESIPLSPNFPRSFSFINLRVTELCHEYALHRFSYRPYAKSMADSATVYMEKVAFCNLGADGFVVLTIHVSGKLVILKNGETKWTVINDLPSPYDDVIFYNGEFYSVDNTGRAVIVDPNTYSLKLVAPSVFGGDKKFLVESDSDLFMLDEFLRVGPEDDDENDDENDEFYGERIVKLKVYKLDFQELKWVEVENLGDRILFVGDNCGFSASASEFPGCKGNCVLFTGESRVNDGSRKTRGVGVFDLDKGNFAVIPDNSGYSHLFWPPPSWLHLNLVALEDGLDHLNF